MTKRFTVIWECLDDSTEFSDDLNETTFGVTEVCDVLNELNNENQHIKQTIREAYESERTQIGKNVLKQLLQQLE